MKRSRKIMMMKRETPAQRAVSFSKRRHGLFNKAAELCLLSGSQIGLIVSSPSSKQNLYTFGYPSVEAVFDAFLHDRVPEAVDSGTMGSAVCLYNAVKDLEVEFEKRTWKKKNDQFDDEFEQLLERCESLSELEVAVGEMEKLKEKAVKRLDDLLAENNLNGMEDHGSLGDVTKSCLKKLGDEVEDQPVVVSGDDHYQDVLGLESSGSKQNAFSFGDDHYQDVMGLECTGSKQDAFSFGDYHCQDVMGMQSSGSKQDAFSFGNSGKVAPDEWYNINLTHDTTSAVTKASACVDNHYNVFGNPVVDEAMPISAVNEWGQLLSYDDPLFFLR